MQKELEYAWTLHLTFLIIWAFTCIKTNITCILYVVMQFLKFGKLSNILL
jgi:hypothetical protein